MLKIILGSSTGILSILTILGAIATVAVSAVIWHIKSAKKEP